MEFMYVVCYLVLGVVVAGVCLRWASPESYDGNEEAYSLVIVIGYPILLSMAAVKVLCKAIFYVVSFIGGK